MIADTQTRDAKIIDRYLGGAMYREIARELGVPMTVAAYVIHKAGVKQGRQSGPKGNPAIAQRNAQIVACYQDGRAIHAIAKEFGLSKWVVGAALNQAGVERNGLRPDPSRIERDERIVQAIKAGRTNASIAQEMGLGDERIRRIRVAKGLPRSQVKPKTIAVQKRDEAVKRRSCGRLPATTTRNGSGEHQGQRQGRHRVKDPAIAARDAKVIELVKAGRSNSSIGRELGVSGEIIRRVRMRLGLPTARMMPAQPDPERKDPVVTARNAAIVRRYLDRDDESYEQIAKILGVTRNEVTRAIRGAGVAQARHKRRDPAIVARNAKIIARYQEGVALKAIAQEFGISVGTVSSVISQAGVATRGGFDVRPSVPDPAIAARNQRIIARYQEGVALKAIAQEFGISVGTVSSVITRAAVANRGSHARASDLAARNEMIIAKKKAGESYRQIAQEIGVSVNVVKATIYKTGSPRRHYSSRTSHHHAGATP